MSVKIAVKLISLGCTIGSGTITADDWQTAVLDLESAEESLDMGDWVESTVLPGSDPKTVQARNHV